MERTSRERERENTMENAHAPLPKTTPGQVEPRQRDYRLPPDYTRYLRDVTDPRD